MAGGDPSDHDAQRSHQPRLFFDWKRQMRERVRAIWPSAKIDDNAIGLAWVAKRAPLHDVRARLNLPLRVRPARAVAANERLQVRTAGEDTEVVVPRVRICEIVEFVVG